MEKGKNLIFTAKVQTKPEVKLGKYKGIEIKKIEYNVSDKDIDQEFNLMAEKNARLVTIEDRPVQKYDIAVIDFEGFLDGKPFEGGKAENHELTIGSNTFIPGFEDQDVYKRQGFIHGIVRDSQGRKMSKSLGNGIDPIEIIDKYGTDALRFSLVLGISPGNDISYMPCLLYTSSMKLDLLQVLEQELLTTF